MAKGNSEEQSKGLYNKWLSDFTSNIFLQTFQAAFLMFIMRMLNTIQKSEADNFTIAILSIVAMMAIIKFEALVKRIFGIKDGIAGTLKTSGAVAVEQLKNAQKLGREAAAPFSQAKDARRQMYRNGNKLGIPETGPNKIGDYVKKGSDQHNAILGRANVSGTTNVSGTVETKDSNRGPAVAQSQAIYNNVTGKTTEINSDGSTKSVKVIRTKGRNIEEEIDKYNDSVLEDRKSRRKMYTQTAGNVASIALGMGLHEDFGTALITANSINNSINAVSNGHIDRGETVAARDATGNRDRYDARSYTEAIKQGFKEASRDMKDDRGNLNLRKMTVEIGLKPVKTYTSAIKTGKTHTIDDINNI